MKQLLDIFCVAALAFASVNMILATVFAKKGETAIAARVAAGTLSALFQLATLVTGIICLTSGVYGLGLVSTAAVLFLLDIFALIANSYTEMLHAEQTA